MTDQQQKAASGSTAIQSGRDTIVQGYGPEDVKGIMESLAATQIPLFKAMAREVADERIAFLEERMMPKFEDGSARAEAFKDPDFQYVFTRALYSFARSGEPLTADTLVELIARRSQEEQRSRLSLTLNEAVDKAATLTNNGFAELSLAYLFRYTSNTTLGSLDKLVRYLNGAAIPLLKDISREESSYWYLEAQS